jgi:8-oxo-dGTP pyrophosphatase MutT (NUDIX family)
MGSLPKAACMVLYRHGKIVAIHHRVRQGYELPGGKVEPGENAAEAAVRECEEETGYRPKQFWPLYAGMNNGYAVFVFVGVLELGALLRSSSEGSTVMLSLEQFLERATFPEFSANWLHLFSLVKPALEVIDAQAQELAILRRSPIT